MSPLPFKWDKCHHNSNNTDTLKYTLLSGASSHSLRPVSTQRLPFLLDIQRGSYDSTAAARDGDRAEIPKKKSCGHYKPPNPNSMFTCRYPLTKQRSQRQGSRTNRDQGSPLGMGAIHIRPFHLSFNFQLQKTLRSVLGNTGRHWGREPQPTVTCFTQ